MCAASVASPRKRNSKLNIIRSSYQFLRAWAPAILVVSSRRMVHSTKTAHHASPRCTVNAAEAGQADWEVASRCCRETCLCFFHSCSGCVCSQRPHTTHLSDIEPASIRSTIVSSPSDTEETTPSRDNYPQTQCQSSGQKAASPASCITMYVHMILTRGHVNIADLISNRLKAW